MRSSGRATGVRVKFLLSSTGGGGTTKKKKKYVRGERRRRAGPVSQSSTGSLRCVVLRTCVFCALTLRSVIFFFTRAMCCSLSRA